jgi:hypothetical protein
LGLSLRELLRPTNQMKTPNQQNLTPDQFETKGLQTEVVVRLENQLHETVPLAS